MRAREVNENNQFNRTGTPMEKLGIGLNAKVMNFLNWVRNDYQFDKSHPEYFGYINLASGDFSDPQLEEGFILFVRDWSKYLKIMRDMGLYLLSKPDEEETIIYDEDNISGVEAIRESLNFERGKDPIKSMGLGIDPNVIQLFSLIREFFEHQRNGNDPRTYLKMGINDWGTMRYRNAYKEFIKDWRKYLGIMKSNGLYIFQEPDMDLTVFYDDPKATGRPPLTESLNFERGKDPKSSMKIGSAIGGETLLNIIMREGSKSPNVFIAPKSAGKIGKWDYLDFPGVPGNKDMHIYIKFIMKQHRSLYTHKKVYVILNTNGDVYYVDDEFEEYHILKDIKDFFKYFNKTKLKESLNFERGKDPLDAMNIGQKALLKERASKIFWDWFPDPSDAEEVLGLETWKGINKYNIKIARLKDNLGYTAYYAVSDTGEPYMESPTFYETPGEALHYELIFLKQFDNEQDELE